MVRRSLAGILGMTLASGLVVGTTVPAATAAPAAEPTAITSPEKAAHRSDEVVTPMERKRRELREQALNLVLTGRARAEKRGASTVVKVGTKPRTTFRGRATGGNVDQYVELAREQTDKIFVALVEFGNERHPDYPDQDTDPDTPGPIRFDGPVHNQIPAPDRTKDNTTVWQRDYARAHYQQLYFGKGAGVESLKTYYERQSSGRYSVDGMVTDWVKVRYNEARYGRKDGDAQFLIRDAISRWVESQRAKGRTAGQIAAMLKSFDVWDRNDYDGDGNFNEPDGYLDHFQIVHAGGDEADGDPLQGEDAIWSHRAYAFYSDLDRTGPAYNKRGGTQVGRTGLWVGDYTIQPENGGLSVFCHEFGHDKGLPDHYDTSGGGQNGVNWWTIMAQSRVSAPGEPLGTRTADFSAWDKLQLGWLDYEVVLAGQNRTLELGPHEYNSPKAQGVVVVLPKKTVTRKYGEPAAGTKMWWSSRGNDLSTTMSRELDLTGKSAAELTLKARFDIEAAYDYLYIQGSVDGGKTWTSLDGTAGGKPFDRDASGSPAISGTSEGKWVDTVVPLTGLAGKKVTFRFLYRTDGGLALDGFFADEIKIVADGAELVSDGAESGPAGWTLKGFRATTGTEVNTYDNYYIASHRSHVSYDKYLKTGPYNFGFLPDRPDWVEHFAYQQGLVISYWDTSLDDNNTSQHPGEGLVLPIDSHPQPIYNLAGKAWSPRIGGYDAPFSLDKADSFTLHINGQASYIRGQPGEPTFDDSRQYWFAEQPTAGVKVPNAGVRIQVTERKGTTMKIKIGSTK
jgi:immune inhibitor A